MYPTKEQIDNRFQSLERMIDTLQTERLKLDDSIGKLKDEIHALKLLKSVVRN